MFKPNITTMKYLIILLAIFIGFNAFNQIPTKKVTLFKGKMKDGTFELKKMDAKIWYFYGTSIKEKSTFVTEWDEVNVDANSLTLEQKEMGVKIVIDVANLSAITFLLNDSKQYVESTENFLTIESVDDSEILVDKIDSKITPKNVSFIKWEFHLQIFILEKSESKNWTFTRKDKWGLNPTTFSLTETKTDANSIYFASTDEESRMLQLIIDLINKKVLATSIFNEFVNGKWIEKRMEDNAMFDESDLKILSIK